MLCWKVVKGEQAFLVFSQAFGRFGELGLVTGDKLIVGR